MMVKTHNGFEIRQMYKKVKLILIRYNLAIVLNMVYPKSLDCDFIFPYFIYLTELVVFAMTYLRIFYLHIS